MTDHRLPEPDEHVYAFPLSSAQERMWFLEQLESGAANQIVGAVEMHGVLDRDALTQALNGIVQRHETLRTTFRTMGGTPAQVIGKGGVAPFEVRTEATEDDVQAALASEARQPFNLERGPLLRVVLFRLSDRRHVVMVAIHHMVCDGWSLGVFVKELVALYAAALHRVEPQLPALTIQYADYALWQRDWLAGEGPAAQLAYWRKQLQGSLPVLELPADRPRPPVESHRGGRLPFKLSAEMTRELIALSRRENATLFMVLVAAFTALLARYTGQDDVIVGTPVAGRGRPELEGLIGLFLNTLVLRMDTTGDPTFAELLRRVRETALDAYANQDVPFERLVEELHPARDPSRNPLFQVMFILQNPASVPGLPGLELRPFEVDRGAAQFDLTLSMFESAGTLGGRWEYSTDLFDCTTIERMAHHYEQLLAALLADPTRRLSEVRLLSAKEQAQIATWNTTAAPYPREAGLLGLLAEQVERQPGATAVRQGNRTLTFAALDAAATRLADFLTGLGVGPDVLVGICLDRTPDMLVALLGVLKAGGAYVPLDPGFPSARLAFMIENSGAQVVLTRTAHAGLIPPSVAHVVCLDRDWTRIETVPSMALSRLLDPTDLAYVIYTSGSTGQPKGVEVSHGALVNLLASMAREPGCTATDTLLAVTTLSFDIAALEVFLPLICGGTVVLATREEAADPQRLITLLGTTGATVMQATPATWRMLIDAGWQGTPGLKVLCGGEALPRDLAKALQARAAEVWNVYGPTETTIWSSAWKVEPGDGPVSIGRPIANTQMYVVDRWGNPQPVGVVGELCIGGDGLARGYRNRPDLTTERFVADPFSKVPGGRLYRTGDLARWRPDGTIECLGRLDHQVKIRGFRIELGEIETALERHPGVRQAVVVPRAHDPGNPHLVGYAVLVAYLTAETEERINSRDLRAFLKGVLPDYMIPSAFVWLDKFPLTSNGKVDRRALPVPSSAPTNESPESAYAPWSELEVTLARLWEDTLGVKPVGRRDNFFDIGGHSLLAARLFARIEKEFDRKLPLSVLFEAPTVAGLAALIQKEGWSPSWRSLVPIQPKGTRPPIFALPGVGGNVVGYAQLGELLGVDQPFYGLQARGLDGKEAPLTSMEEIAAHHIAEIRTVQPQGPYFLIGLCVGGVIAYEMAQQLVQEGEEIGMLAMLDSWPGSSVRRIRTSPRVDRGLAFLRLVFGRLKDYTLTFARLPMNERWDFIVSRMSKIKSMTAERNPFGEARHEFSQTIIERANIRALDNYVIRPYRGRILYFFAENRWQRVAQFDSRSVWRRFAAGGFELYTLPTPDSGRMLNPPHVHVLAERIRAYLQHSDSQVDDVASVTRGRTAQRIAHIHSMMRGTTLPADAKGDSRSRCAALGVSEEGTEA